MQHSLGKKDENKDESETMLNGTKRSSSLQLTSLGLSERARERHSAIGSSALDQGV